MDLGSLARKKRFLPWSGVKKRGRSQRGGIISAFLPGEEVGKGILYRGYSLSKDKDTETSVAFGEQQVV